METRNVILVIAAGWVIICRQSLTDPTRIVDARVIQHWGTTDGLAQIALHGPTSNTTLSATFSGYVPPAGILFAIDVADGVSWTG